MAQRKVLVIDAGHQAFDELDATDLTSGGAAPYTVGGTDVPVTDGGTGASTASGARTNLGVVIGTDVRAQGSGDPTRASLGLATSDSPQFAGIEVGAASDTTLTRASAGVLSVEGNALYAAGGTDVPVTDGGTGASTAADARTNLGLGSLATASSLAHSATTGQTANDHHAQSHNHSAAGDSTALLPVTLLLPNSAGITLPTTEGYIGEDSTPHNVLVYDSQRQRVVGEVGWMPYAYPAGYYSGATINTTTTLPAAGGSIATPIYVGGHMLLQQLRFRQQDTSLLRTAEWQLYVQYLNNGNAGENTLAAVTGAYGTISFTPSGASTQTSTATGAPVYLGPGMYWIVIRNTHASNTFGLAGGPTGTIQNDIAQTKTLGSALGSTLDFVAASWFKVGTGPLGLILEGRVFGQTAAF